MLLLPSISGSTSLVISPPDDIEITCALLRQEVRRLIENGKSKEANTLLQKSYLLLTNIFDACKVAELFYNIDEPENAIKALQIATKLKPRYKFEVTEAIKLLEEHHSDTKKDLIAAFRELRTHSAS